MTKMATFTLYTAGYSEAELRVRNGERVEVLRLVPADHCQFVTWRVRFSDGTEEDAFGDELTEWSAA